MKKAQMHLFKAALLSFALFGADDIVAAEAGQASASASQHIFATVGADVITHLIHREMRSHEVALVTHVDTEVTRVRNRRTRDAEVHLGGASVANELHQRPSRGASHRWCNRTGRSPVAARRA